MSTWRQGNYFGPWYHNGPNYLEGGWRPRPTRLPYLQPTPFYYYWNPPYHPPYWNPTRHPDNSRYYGSRNSRSQDLTYVNRGNDLSANQKSGTKNLLCVRPIVNTEQKYEGKTCPVSKFQRPDGDHCDEDTKVDIRSELSLAAHSSKSLVKEEQPDVMVFEDVVKSEEFWQDEEFDNNPNLFTRPLSPVATEKECKLNVRKQSDLNLKKDSPRGPTARNNTPSRGRKDCESDSSAGKGAEAKSNETKTTASEPGVGKSTELSPGGNSASKSSKGKDLASKSSLGKSLEPGVGVGKEDSKSKNPVLENVESKQANDLVLEPWWVRPSLADAVKVEVLETVNDQEHGDESSSRSKCASSANDEGCSAVASANKLRADSVDTSCRSDSYRDTVPGAQSLNTRSRSHPCTPRAPKEVKPAEPVRGGKSTRNKSSKRKTESLGSESPTRVKNKKNETKDEKKNRCKTDSAKGKQDQQRHHEKRKRHEKHTRVKRKLTHCKRSKTRSLAKKDLLTCSYICEDKVVSRCPLGHFLDPSSATWYLTKGYIKAFCSTCSLSVYMFTEDRKVEPK